MSRRARRSAAASLALIFALLARGGLRSAEAGT